MIKKVIGASWKNHVYSINHGKTLITEIKNLVKDIDSIDMFILPTFPMIPMFMHILNGSNLQYGAQNVSFEEQGPYTGEVPPLVLKELGCKYIEIGHTERRNLFNETDKIINKKAKLTLKNEMTPVICIGESSDDKINKLDKTRIKTQILWSLDSIDKEDIGKIILAYEPAWAIGQQESADPDYVEDVHSFIKDILKNEYGIMASENIRIIYGGSVSPKNAELLLTKENIDGLFIGRFGLRPKNFKNIVEIASRISV